MKSGNGDTQGGTKKLRNRVIERRQMRIGDIMDNPDNWRTHPKAQRQKMEGILAEIGKAGSVKAYYSERYDGRLCFIDGHLRKDIDPDEVWDVEILDLSDEEADKLLLSYDYIGAQAGVDPEKLKKLTDSIQMNDHRARDIWHDQTILADKLLREMDSGEEEDEDPIEAMELLPFEHYDYVLLLFRTTFDWERAVELLGLERVKSPINSKKIGTGRAIDGAVFLDLIEKGKKQK